MSSIYGKEHKLKDIFSDRFVFTIPSYQRPYSWKKQHAEALINDLIDFMNESPSLENLPPYFLGSIVLIKQEGSPNAEIVDGQQRLTTLTILISVLRELIPSNSRDLTKFLYEEGNQIAGTSNRYRLTLRERDAEFFQKFIQNEGGIEKLIKLSPDTLSDSQKNIQSNTLLILEHVKRLLEEQRVYLAQAIVLHCYLVEISTSDLDSAYNVFSILNDRGLNLSHSDILKAQITGKIPQKQRYKYTEKWEESEQSLGREVFSKLFYYLNTIYRSQGPKAILQQSVEVTKPLTESLLISFRKYVYPAGYRHPDPKQFINDILVPYANALYVIENLDYRRIKGKSEINKLLQFLFALPSRGNILRDVMRDNIKAIIMYHMVSYPNSSDETLKFLQGIERLDTFMTLNVERYSEYQERLLDVMDFIREKKDLYTANSPLQLTQEEKEKFLSVLNDNNFYQKDSSLYILLRLDRELAAPNEAIYNYDTVTIEHVLPQNPKKDSIWLELFPLKEERENYVNSLANLVLLSKRKNSEAQNYEFEKKKRKYFLSEKGTSSFVLTSQVLQEDKWTVEVLQHRQEMLIAKLKTLYRLN